MKIILLQDIAKVGKKYEEKTVADGYAHNLLIPQKKAIISTPENRKKILGNKKIHDIQAKEKMERFESALMDLEKKKIIITAKANEKGHLFAGIGNGELSLIIKEQGILDIESQYILLNKPIKEVGEYKIEIKVGGKKATLNIVVEPEA